MNDQLIHILYNLGYVIGNLLKSLSEKTNIFSAFAHGLIGGCVRTVRRTPLHNTG